MRTFETVEAEQEAQVLGNIGGVGDALERITIVPATVSPGIVTLLDGDAEVLAFPGGTDSLPDLKPIDIEINTVSQNGAWKITTGVDVSVIAVGDFRYGPLDI